MVGAVAAHGGRASPQAGLTRAGAALALVAVALTIVGCGPDGLVNRLNLLGQTRYKVGDQVYGLEGLTWTASEVEIELGRALPAGDIRQSDADAISAVEGIVLVDATGQQLPVGDVTIRPADGGSGAVVLVFDVQGHPGPWSLEWPDHKPYSFGP